MSGSYFAMLTLATLIALSILITNSAPVIIGAMVISPLTGPLLSFGFDFITATGTSGVARSGRYRPSGAITIAVAALASMLSPLKELTSEILALLPGHSLLLRSRWRCSALH